MPRKKQRKSGKKPGKSGRYCWSCQRKRSNESFGGAGHARHLCRECSQLGKDKLDFRSARANLERMMTEDGLLRRTQRRHFRKFLEDPRPRVQELAQHLWKLDEQVRRELREARDAQARDAKARGPTDDAEPMEWLP